MTPTHLALEYVVAGELFDRMCFTGRLSEDEVNLLEVGSFYKIFF